jgi:integrase
LTVDQSAALLAELRRVEETSPYLSQRYAAQAIQLLALSGARREEIFGLEWQDVAEDCLELALRRTKTGPRTLCLGAEARHVLARVPKQPGESQVFPGANYRSVWWPVRSAVGLPKLHLHDLRCTFSTRLHEAGVPIQHIAAALGQRTVSVNVKYYMSLSAETMAGIANLGSRLVASQTKEGVTK